MQLYEFSGVLIFIIAGIVNKFILSVIGRNRYPNPIAPPSVIIMVTVAQKKYMTLSRSKKYAINLFCFNSF